MRNASCVKGLETAGIGKTVKRGRKREEGRGKRGVERKRATGVEAEVDSEWRRRGREERWNEVALKLGQVYSVSVSPLIDHRHPPTTPCGSTYHRLWSEGGSCEGVGVRKHEKERTAGGRPDKLLQQFIFICRHFPAPLRSPALDMRMLAYGTNLFFLSLLGQEIILKHSHNHRARER